MKYYHGSTVGGLTELEPRLPFGGPSQEPRVYLTTSRQLALHYIWDVERLALKMPMLKILDDGTLIFQEMFSGALEYFYKGVSGYIYCCEGDFPVDSAVLTSVSTDQPVPIVGCEYIDDVYEHILQYEKQGKFIYEHYEDLPQWRRDVIRGHVIRMIKRFDLMKDDDHPGRGFPGDASESQRPKASVLREIHK